MCGIIAIVRRPSTRACPAAADILGRLEPVGPQLAAASGSGSGPTLARGLAAGAEEVGAVDRLLRGSSGVRALLGDPSLLAGVRQHIEVIAGQIADIEATLDRGPGDHTVDDLEAINAALVALKDAVWAVQRDRIRTVAAVAELTAGDTAPAIVDGYLSIQQALSSIDRLEVRGRDSAGLQVLVRHHGLDLDAPALRSVLAERAADPLFTSMAVRTPEGHLSFVYKASAEIGELGDNTKVLRSALAGDALLRQALGSSDTAEALVLGHTRWASVGIISQANAHPLDSEELDRTDGPFVSAVLNGDVDNFADLKARESLGIATEITTDAKVIPTLTSRRLAAGDDTVEAFRSTVNRLEGSVAIGASVATDPGDLLLALRGSGQAVYVGVAEDLFIVASEPYGVVEETDHYLRMDGETPADAEDPTATRGQIIRLRGAAAGDVAGIERWAYDGSPRPVTADELATAQITTRDIDRGAFPHFLLKEVSESPSSFRKTLRGKLVEVDGRLTVHVGDALPAATRTKLRDGSITRVMVIGQGTAAVAGQAMAEVLTAAASGSSLRVNAVTATELSGFDLTPDMADTLVIAISQSGTTTDTNRTVDLVRGRGATVVAIVNRRNSDLTDKADGVLYTSDGRDVEMAVPSTKAFYAQIAAGFLLSVAIADEVGTAPGFDEASVLEALRALPDQMERALDCRDAAAEAAQRFAPSRRYWAVVGNGMNRIAAEEVRIKISELCYKSIACDATEDKKHIDLSSEPLILVCAAGLTGSTADDVAKEVAIYRAHKAAPIVIASGGESRFSAALQVIAVPETHPMLAFVLSTMAGHLFGYEAALAIDAQARQFREGRAVIEAAVFASRESEEAADEAFGHLSTDLVPMVGRFFDGLRSNEYDGHLEASSAVRLASLFRYALGWSPLETYQVEYGRVGTPSVIIEDLISALTKAIEELTRPVDAIKHQAKTVTVGISRSDETLLQARLVREVLAAGSARDRLSYDSLRTLAVLDPLVDEALGYTRYRIEGTVAPLSGRTTLGAPGLLEGDEPRIVVVDRGGLGRELRSRTEDNPELRGTKRRVAAERQVYVGQGRSDGRTVLFVPEVKDNQTTGMTLLHVSLRADLPLVSLRSVLQGYRGRYQALKDAVTETEPTFRDDLLTDIDVVELMTAPIYDLADRWRS
jgi:glucosamine--fructose-6-phosphate aminotransferase (isomerizing)